MPRELVTVQIGQCGLQVGTKFWELAMLEHRQYNRSGLFDESMSSFFRNVDTRSHPPLDIALLNAQGQANPIASLKARAVLVDMEEGVLDSLMRDARGLGELFDERQTVASVSGSGNNWAHGHCHYGKLYGDSILEAVRRQTEHCDSLQAFLFMHSLGGGTGSGLGTYILGALEDAHPDIYRFVAGVFPSDQDDVVTSPYNSMLSLSQLIQHADAVMPIHNQALMDICEKINKPRPGAGGKATDSLSSAAASSSSSKLQEKNSLLDLSSGDAAAARRAQKNLKRQAFDDMNTLAAQLLTSLTCSMRFEGPLNVDLNEITMNLVPFPRMHFLVSSLAPLYTAHKDASSQALKFGSATDSRVPSSASAASSISAASSLLAASKSIDSMFSTAFHPDSHLVKINPRNTGLYLACGLFGRGADLTVSDMNRNIARLKSTGVVNLMGWNEDGFKIGLCSTPPVGLKHSLLSLSNSSAIAPLFLNMRDRCLKMYSRKANFHHYLEYMEQDVMDRAFQEVEGVVALYADLERKENANRSRDAQFDDEEEPARGEGFTQRQQPRMRPM